MATVHSIVTAAGGGLGVQSELGEGTTIRAYFPAVAELASAEAATAATADAGGHGETILVAEDEAAVLRVVIRILERDNYSVLAAPNGTGAHVWLRPGPGWPRTFPARNLLPNEPC